MEQEGRYVQQLILVPSGQDELTSTAERVVGELGSACTLCIRRGEARNAVTDVAVLYDEEKPLPAFDKLAPPIR